MTPEEVEARFLRIEANLEATSATLQRIADGWGIQQQNMGSLMEVHKLMEQAITRYIDASEVRMKRMEENLDALIRAITAEHSNGKAK